MMDKDGRMIVRGRIAAALCLCLIFLAGCGEAKVPDVVDVPSVSVGKEGDVTVWQVGVFDRDDYVLSELQAMAVEEAGRFNSSMQKEAAVAIEKVEELNDGSGKVVVTYRFDGWESCTAYLEEELFFGTMSEAVLRGFGSGITLKSVKDDAVLPEGQLMQDTDSNLLVTDMKANVYCPGKVTHISDGARVNPDGSVDTSGADGRIYILYR